MATHVYVLRDKITNQPLHELHMDATFTPERVQLRLEMYLKSYAKIHNVNVNDLIWKEK